MTCTDVYVLEQDTCVTGDMWIYPSQVHPIPPPVPTGTGGGGPTGEVIWRTPYRDTEEDILAALGFFGPDI